MKLNLFGVLGLYLDRLFAWIVLELLMLFQQSFISNKCYFQVLGLTVIIFCLLGFNFVRRMACANRCLRSVLTNLHLVVAILFLALAIFLVHARKDASTAGHEAIICAFDSLVVTYTSIWLLLNLYIIFLDFLHHFLVLLKPTLLCEASWNL